MDALYQARVHGLVKEKPAWSLQKVLLAYLQTIWHVPDNGIWEIRGEPQHFVHSKVMAWVAFDRCVRAVEAQALDGPVEHWRAIRDEIHRDVCEHGFDNDLQSFTQSYGSKELDASLLLGVLFGYGERFDETAMQALSAGSVWTEPAKQPHFAWSRNGEVVLQVIGMGPSGTTPVP